LNLNCNVGDFSD
jgi:hypothetical protein